MNLQYFATLLQVVAMLHEPAGRDELCVDFSASLLAVVTLTPKRGIAAGVATYITTA